METDTIAEVTAGSVFYADMPDYWVRLDDVDRDELPEWVSDDSAVSWDSAINGIKVGLDGNVDVIAVATDTNPLAD